LKAPRPLLALLLAGCNLALPLQPPVARDSGRGDDADMSHDLAARDGTADLPPAPDIGPCPHGQRDGGDCRGLVPANIASLPPSCSDVSLLGDPIDTKTCKLTTCAGAVAPMANGADVCVLSVGRLTVSGVVKVSGPLPLVIVASGDVTIQGTLDGAAQGEAVGPGGNPGGESPGDVGGKDGLGAGGGKHCGCPDSNYDDCGGGGGGFGEQGGNGGEEAGGCATKSAGGALYGTANLEPLEGGSGGASGHNYLYMAGVNALGAGGAGGGALQISSQGTIRIDGAITVGGGGGQPGDGSQSAGGGGGGSGGAILIEAVRVEGNGWLAANGGGGGGGAEVTSPGQPVATAGEDGRPSGAVALGGGGGGTGTAGGAGGTGAEKPQPGGDVKTSGYGGCGGGGGASGRIRVNLVQKGTPFPQHSGFYTEGSPRAL